MWSRTPRMAGWCVCAGRTDRLHRRVRTGYNRRQFRPSRDGAREKETHMTRVAMVTGGTRGIGKAIVQRLNEDGFRVAAGYSGNTAAAEATAAELGVMVVKGNVGS